MEYSLFAFIKQTAAAITADGVLLTFILIVLGLFFVFLGLKLKGGFKEKNLYLYYLLSSECAVVFACAVFLAAEIPFEVFAFYFALLSVFACILLFPLVAAKKKEREYAEEKKLIKFIDEKIKSEPPAGGREKTETLFPREAEILPREKEEKESGGVDFSHVKNVIERLNYFDLSPSDKKQVEILKDLLYSAENFGLSAEKKSKINDGLSSLLKIMSKYGV